jgi:hypothetical protein
MMRIAISWIAILSLGLVCPFGAVAQPRNSPTEHWQAIDKSMSDLLLEGYRPVSVIAPSSHLRIYFLSSGSFLTKCTEQAVMAGSPPMPAHLPPSATLPPSGQQPASAMLPGQQIASAIPPPQQMASAQLPPPDMQVTFACSRLSKSQ